MTPNRIQLGRYGPQFSYAWHRGRLCVLDHDRGRSVTNGAEQVCAFLRDQLPEMGLEHDIIYLATDKRWCVLLLRKGVFAGIGRGYRAATDDEAALASEAFAMLLQEQGVA